MWSKGQPRPAKPGRTTDRLLSFFMYLVLAVVVAAAGLKLIDYGLDMKFYHHFLKKWGTALQTFSARSGQFPTDEAEDKEHYMEHLVQRMVKKGVEIPESNTDSPYVYDMNYMDLFDDRTRVFIVGEGKKIVIHNLSLAGFERLDKIIDGRHDMDAGNLTGKAGKDEHRYVGRFLF